MLLVSLLLSGVLAIYWFGSFGLAPTLHILPARNVQEEPTSPAINVPTLKRRFTDDVAFDNYSLIIKGQRVFI
jgi:hypothetical protein